ncbi:hypothetical protein AAZX31_14G139000 [Glycine max]
MKSLNLCFLWNGNPIPHFYVPTLSFTECNCPHFKRRKLLILYKGRRPLPKQGFTCCLAMDDVKVLASGFDTDEMV